jgi:hypothetical protein
MNEFKKMGENPSDYKDKEAYKNKNWDLSLKTTLLCRRKPLHIFWMMLF